MKHVKHLLFAVALGLALPAAAEAPTELGLDLIPWSKKVSDRRYDSPRDYEGTVKFFKDKFKGWKNVKWTRETALPNVKFIHVENTNPDGKWQGINIYEMANGRVRYYVLERPKKDEPKKDEPKKDDTKKPEAAPKT